MEKEEFKRIWLPHSDGFYRVAFSMLGSEADAKDAVQDLYVKLWNLRGYLGEVRSPSAYGIRLLRNICIDKIRMRSSHGAVECLDILTDGLAGVPVGKPADCPLIDREAVKRLEEVMSALPDNQRRVMELRFFRQLDYDEICRKTGLGAVNVRVLVSRARTAVAAALKEYINF